MNGVPTAVAGVHAPPLDGMQTIVLNPQHPHAISASSVVDASTKNAPTTNGPKTHPRLAWYPTVLMLLELAHAVRLDVRFDHLDFDIACRNKPTAQGSINACAPNTSPRAAVGADFDAHPWHLSSWMEMALVHGHLSPQRQLRERRFSLVKRRNGWPSRILYVQQPVLRLDVVRHLHDLGCSPSGRETGHREQV